MSLSVKLAAHSTFSSITYSSSQYDFSALDTCWHLQYGVHVGVVRDDARGSKKE